ncbi:hypothetical protein TrST_g817 [Triparma strigata]|uniref:Uncharacterized protein n=1 Tax=Triparma strigata TaxID=1606541 RepID=A0A9W7BAZ2_9STRA|nr:hypothetical protein TrST_g817 [Triparma strigata]
MQAEKEELLELVAQLKAEKDEAVAKLAAQRGQFQKVMAEIKSDKTLQERRRNLDASSNHVTTTTLPLDRNKPDVINGVNGMLLRDTITKTLTQTIHEEPEVFLRGLTESYSVVGRKSLFQEVIEDEQSNDREHVVYWAFMSDGLQCCELILRLRVKRDGEDIVIGVSSVGEEGENREIKEQLDSTLESPLPDVIPNGKKRLRIILRNGTMLLRRYPYGQTLLTFSTELHLEEVKDTSAGVGTKRKARSTLTASQIMSQASQASTKKLALVSLSSNKANEMFCKLCTLFY